MGASFSPGVDQVDALNTRQVRRRLTPKRPQSETAGYADIFPYYAGFSYEWACAQLDAKAVSPDAIVLDPWNGSGTTTLAAQSKGLRSVGIDLNPIANIVARLRVQTGSDLTISQPPSVVENRKLTSNDPLLHWFSPRTVRRFRAWTDELEKLPTEQSALGYVSLFRIVRALTKKSEGSNPTWVRRTVDRSARADLRVPDLDALIMAEQSAIAARFADKQNDRRSVQVITASSKCLPLADRSIDLILTSPPYLTRIDYAVAYSRELAILGVDVARDRSLRSDLMGTTLIRREPVEVRRLGTVATKLLDDVAAHPSHASGVYYLKQTRQYLLDLTSSLDEISRVAKPGAYMHMVVQDSYYKDIHVRLADICVEEASLRGWKFCSWEKAEVTRMLTQVNTAARTYAKGVVDETVLTLQRS